MNTKLIMAIVFCLPFFMGCQRLYEQGEQTSPNPEQELLVADSAGNLFDVGCLRTNASAIIELGKNAASGCMVGNAKTIETSNSNLGRGFSSSSYWWWYYWYIYPPTYYSNDSNNSNNNQFCDYIFGYSYDYDCYDDFFGFDSYQSSYYNPYCHNSCLYNYDSKCYNRCWYKKGWYWW